MLSDTSKSPIIYSAWLQGRGAAPLKVRRILDLWEKLNPEFRLHVVEQAEADAILAECGIKQKRITPQVTTNVVRKVLLARTGGFWVDATLLPMRPLREWFMPDLTQAGFFAFRSGGDPNLTLQNWFIYAQAKNPLIVGWRDAYVDYFRQTRLFPTWRRALIEGRPLDYLRYLAHIRKRDTLWFVDPDGGRDCAFYPYAASNYNLTYLLKTRPDLAALWATVPARWADLPHLIGRMARDCETPEPTFIASAVDMLPLSPVHKLNSRDKRINALLDLTDRD